MRLWYFEDFTAGQILPGSETLVSHEDAAWFAAEFSPRQLIAGDEAGGRGIGRATAAGFYVSALGMRLVFEAFLARTASFGAPGVDEVDWPNPVYAGDRLRLAGRVASVRPSRSRPEMGLVGFEFTITNQYDECVMRQSNVMLIQRRTEEG